nr:retrovirus-related Pol polyprotein from transposon TNT 1-94 [Tanacetum cinerariifolium]
MKMEHYLCHTDYPIWQVIQNVNGLVSVTTYTHGMIKVLPPKTAEEVVAREKERKAKTTLLMALPEDQLAKFHLMADTKETWEAIKSRFGEGLHKGYNRFQTLLSQLKIHGAGVLNKDANQKFLRSLPSSWSQVALIMRTKPGLNTLSFDDLYNNLSVFERDVKGTTASSSSNIQNAAFMSTDNTSSTNDVSTIYSVSSPSVSKSPKEGSSSYIDEVIRSFFTNKSSAPQLDCDDLEQINDDDLEEIDLKWQVAMISIRIKKFHKRTGKKLQFDTRDTVGFDKTKVECFNCHKIRHFARDCRAKWNQDSRRRDEDIDWSGHVEEDTKNYAMMAYSNSGSDNESVFMNKDCDLENTPVNDRYAEGMHAVLPPMTGNYMPSGPDVEIDYSKFTYGPKHTLVDESDAKTYENASSESDSSVETTTSMPAPVDNAPKDDPHKALKDNLIIDSGCSRHMTGNKDHLANYQKFKGGSIAFGGSNGRITGKRKIEADRKKRNTKPLAKLRHMFSWVYFLKSNDETTPILKDFIRQAENQFDYKVKTIRSDNGTEFKNHELIEFYGSKGIKREYSNAKTPQQNRVDERKNRTFIEASRTMLADLFLPTTIWAEAVNSACYVLYKVLVNKPQNKTPYELLTGRQPIISYLRPFVCHVTILNTIDQLGKFDGKSDSGFLVGYSLNSKAFREKEATHDSPDANTNSTNLLNAVSAPVSAVGPSRALNNVEPSYPDDPSMPHLEDIYASPSVGIFTNSSYDDEGVVTDFNNLETTVWILVDLPFGKKAIGTKWVYRNKKDEWGVVVRNKARLVAQGHRQEEGIDYDEVFAPVARIKAIKIFLAFASYMGFIVYQMDVKSAFMYGTIDEEVYVTKPPSFVDPKFPNKVYKVVKALYGLHQAPRAWPHLTLKSLPWQSSAFDYLMGHVKHSTGKIKGLEGNQGLKGRD